MDFAIATELYTDDYQYSSDNFLKSDSEIDLVKVIQQLHGSLDPRTVFACYGKIIGQHLPVTAIQIYIGEQKYTWGRLQGIALHRNITVDNVNVALHYYLSKPLCLQHIEQLIQLETLVSLPLHNALKHKQMSNHAMFDALTGLGNRFYYHKYIQKALARANRRQSQVSLIVLDLDKFKSINDQFGHLIGDSLLISFSELISESIRDTDHAFRIGGDEFVIVAEGDVQAASLVCQRIIENQCLYTELVDYHVQCSLGIAQAKSQEEVDSLFHRADEAMYTAKAAGRNCFSISEDLIG